MLNPTLTYQTENAKDYRVPVHAIEVAGRVYSTHWLYDYSAEVLADRPVLYLRLGESSGVTARDSSGNGLDGTIGFTTVAPIWGQTGALAGDVNTALRFNGVTANNQRVTVPDNALLDPGDTITLEAWCKPTLVTSTRTLFCKGNLGYVLWINVGVVELLFGGVKIAHSSISVTTGVWHHITATKSGATTKIYIDGVDVTVLNTNQTIADTSDALSVGRLSNGGTVFAGDLDELALYSTALSASRVRAHYEAGLGLRALGHVLSNWRYDYSTEVLRDSPVVYLRLGETSGTVAADASINGLDGEYLNTPTLGVAGALAFDQNLAAEFNGTNERVNVPHNALLNLGDSVTLEAWVKPDAFGHAMAIMAKGDRNFLLYVRPSTGLVYLAKPNYPSANLEIVHSSIAIPIGSYSHVVATKNGKVAKLFINGVDVTVLDTDYTFENIGSSLTVGAKNPIENFFDGTIDEAAVYQTALSAERIRIHYIVGAGLRELIPISECLLPPRGIAAQVEPERGRSSNPAITLTLADLSDYDSEILADNPSLYLGEAPKAGTVWQDQSGNELDATLVNSPTLGDTGPLAGIPNLAVTLNGTTQYASRADNALLDPGDIFTLELWVLMNAIGVTASLLAKGANGYNLLISAAGLLALNKTGAAAIVAATVPIAAGSWYHVVATKAGAAVHLYVNGVDVTGVVTNATIVATASALGIGADSGGGTYVPGSIARPAIYPTALSAERVKAHYLSGTHNFGTSGQISRLVAEGIEGQPVVYKKGFDNICYSDFLEYIPDGVVDSVRSNPNLQAYDLRVSEPLALVKGSIAQCGATVLDADMADTDTACTIPSGGSQFFSASGYFVIDEEIIKFSSKDWATAAILTRGMFGTIPAAHVAGSAISELVRIGPAHPCDLIQEIYTNTGKTGMSIISSLVDSDAFDAVKAASPGLAMEFRLLGEVNAKDFLESELFAKIGAYSVIRGGKLSIVQFKEAAVADAELSDDDILADSTGKPIIGWDDNFGTLVNSLAYGLDFNPILDRPETTPDPFEDPASVHRYGRVPANSRPVISLGFRTSIAQADDFNRADSNSLGANWVESEAYAGAIKIATNQLVMGGGGGGSGNFGYGLAIFAYAFSDIQEVELAFVSTTANGKSGAGVRLSGTDASASGYAFIYDKAAGQLLIKRFSGAAISGGTTLTTYAVVLVGGDTVKLRAYRDELSLYVNGVLVAATVDTEHVAGGIAVVTQQAEAENQVWDAFAAQDDFANTLDYIADFADRILTRYASGGAPLVPLRVFSENDVLEPGDILSLTTDYVLDKTTGQKGIAGELFEVIERAANADGDYVDLMLLRTDA